MLTALPSPLSPHATKAPTAPALPPLAAKALCPTPPAAPPHQSVIPAPPADRCWRTRTTPARAHGDCSGVAAVTREAAHAPDAGRPKHMPVHGYPHILRRRLVGLELAAVRRDAIGWIWKCPPLLHQVVAATRWRLLRFPIPLLVVSVVLEVLLPSVLPPVGVLPSVGD